MLLYGKLTFFKLIIFGNNIEIKGAQQLQELEAKCHDSETRDGLCRALFSQGIQQLQVVARGWMKVLNSHSKNYHVGLFINAKGSQETWVISFGK